MPDAAYPSNQVRAAARATYAVFIAAGFAFASWASRIPQVKGRLGLTPAHLGLVLLALAIGAVIALPLSGLIVHRLTTRGTITVMAVVGAAGLVIVGVGYQIGVLPVMVGLFLFGFANGAWDVAMNVQGADVERHLGKAIMPRYHAGYSVGTVAGALIGALMVAFDVPVTVHLIGVAVVIVVVVPLWVRRFLPDVHTTDEHPSGAKRGVFTRWLEPRTLIVGVVVLAFAFSEGTGNDWISLAAIDGYHVPAAVGALCLAVFLTAMTIGRWAGPVLLDRFGRVAVVRTLALVAFIGLILFVYGAVLPLAFLGAVLWGAGTSLGFPVGMSAAADEPASAAGRVSVVASIGYCAFLGGPPLIGFLGSHHGVLHALVAVGVMLGVATILAAAMRPLPVTRPAKEPLPIGVFPPSPDRG